MRLPLSLLVLATSLLARPAHAGLRPIYGGELAIWAPSEPQATDPAHAWSTVELVLANALGAPLEDLLDEPPTLSGATVHLSVRADATWPDGTPLDARGLAHLLRNALTQSPVALPPFTFRATGGELFAELTTALNDEERYLALPWLRVTRGDDGPFRRGKAGLQMNANALGGRPFAERLRVELHEGKRPEAPADAVVLSQTGGDGRPVFALTRAAGPSVALLRAALATADRAAIARFFVRTPAHVPEGWPLPSVPPVAAAPATVLLAVDSSERDLKTVAERLQILLRNQNINARIAAEDRTSFLTRVANGDYDLALIALPHAPPLVQAATLVRYTEGREAADHFWSRPDIASAAFDAPNVLRSTANAVGASLLYMEDGKILYGARLRANPAPLWDLDPSEIWLMPGSAP